MSGSILDTNIIIDFFRNEQNTVKEILLIEEVYIPVVVVGELYYGAYLSNRTDLHKSKIDSFLKKVKILHINEDTSKQYAKLKFKLKKIGKPIPENDIWIASISIQHNNELLSNDAHFENVEDLEIRKIKI